MSAECSLINEKITDCIKRYNDISLDVMESISELGLLFMFIENKSAKMYTSLINEYKNFEKENIYYSNNVKAMDKACNCLLKYNREV